MEAAGRTNLGLGFPAIASSSILSVVQGLYVFRFSESLWCGILLCSKFVAPIAWIARPHDDGYFKPSAASERGVVQELRGEEGDDGHQSFAERGRNVGRWCAGRNSNHRSSSAPARSHFVGVRRSDWSRREWPHLASGGLHELRWQFRWVLSCGNSGVQHFGLLRRAIMWSCGCSCPVMNTWRDSETSNEFLQHVLFVLGSNLDEFKSGNYGLDIVREEPCYCL